MELLETIGKCLRSYADFRSRSSRSEFWYWILLIFVYFTVILIIRFYLPPLPFYIDVMFQLLLLWMPIVFVAIPTCAVTWRRLNDVNRSGWLAVSPALFIWWNYWPMRYWYSEVLSDVFVPTDTILLLIFPVVNLSLLVLTIFLLVWLTQDSSLPSAKILFRKTEANNGNRFCIECGANITITDHFCYECGAAQSLRCAACNFVTQAEDLFCTKCGEPVESK
jgi:uncharacterized membrane protein YhaH (DUF805 family)/predicted RNA-binding Zn-ribbon protein involved in translation (DUF1610 family)